MCLLNVYTQQWGCLINLTHERKVLKFRSISFAGRFSVFNLVLISGPIEPEFCSHVYAENVSSMREPWKKLRYNLLFSTGVLSSLDGSLNTQSVVTTRFSLHFVTWFQLLLVDNPTVVCSQVSTWLSTNRGISHQFFGCSGKSFSINAADRSCGNVL